MLKPIKKGTPVQEKAGNSTLAFKFEGLKIYNIFKEKNSDDKMKKVFFGASGSAIFYCENRGKPENS